MRPSRSRSGNLSEMYVCSPSAWGSVSSRRDRGRSPAPPGRGHGARRHPPAKRNQPASCRSARRGRHPGRARTPGCRKQTPFAVIRVDDDRRVFQNVLQTLLNLIRRLLRRREGDSGTPTPAAARRLLPRVDLSRSDCPVDVMRDRSPGDTTVLIGNLARSQRRRPRDRAPAPTARP